MKHCIYLLAALALAGCERGDFHMWDELRIVTYNLEDIRTSDLQRDDHPRLLAAARVIQSLRPHMVLLNEVAYDQPGVPGFDGDMPKGSNGRRFAERYLAVSQREDLRPLALKAFMAPSNTGLSSGYDLDRDGQVVTDFPLPDTVGAEGAPPPQTDAQRAYGNDSWGFGTFPGQYAMTLLVDDGFEILEEDVRTFRHFLWKELPGAQRPFDPGTGEYWYDDEVWDRFPLSSKSHWDVPVRLWTGHVLHVLASHPTPAAFDGAENRNKLRNRDEIRFWNAYISGSNAIVDDHGVPGGLPEGASFVIMGDLNADLDEGNAIGDPVGSFLLSLAGVNGDFVPAADSLGLVRYPNLDGDDTAGWGMRVDYILPSADLTVHGGGIARPVFDWQQGVSDHFPVYLDITTPEQ